MNVYRVRRVVTDKWGSDRIGYDEYDAFVCVAESENEARAMMPESDYDAPPRARNIDEYDGYDFDGSWPASATLAVDLIATGAEGPARVVLSSFNAG